MKDGFRLSEGFLRAHRLERATAVRLYFDRAKGMVGFHFPIGPHPQPGTLRLKRHNSGFVLRAAGFFSSYGIDPGKCAGRYLPREVKDQVLKRLFVIQLRAARSGERHGPEGRKG